MHLFNILISDREDDLSLAALPPPIQRNIESFKAHHPGMPHRLYGKNAIRDFLGRMDKEALWAFDQLLPYAYKADLARLCLLHEYGGVYADLSVHFHRAWDVLPGKLSVFRDRAVIAPWIVSNTILAAPARFPAIQAAIRMIVANCHSRYRGTSPLCPTGPVLLGKAIAMHCTPDQIHLGEVTNVAARDTMESLVFVDASDGRLVAYRAKTKAGLDELGLEEGVNNYNDFHYAGVIYANDFPVTVTADYLQRMGQTSCALIDAELVCDPADPPDAALRPLALANLFPFAAGGYGVLMDVSASAGSVLGLVAVRIKDGVELARTTVQLAQDGPATIAAQFDLPASRNDIGIGILASGNARARIRQLRFLRREEHPAATT
ncbi:glycosyltransferase family 32 protein [Noviherbaspirillum sp.]|uniref:glycosyltransferase family 32 protein n=1 Tax=Noviherbaspirillum sp. TaxID=1926288 RepID=UPI002D685F3C|nr:glycosyltransferase [Noviherbaspirillum sp.]HZW20900.1 glycosyltransferase [Noviherbaspirillum sp.]